MNQFLADEEWLSAFQCQGFDVDLTHHEFVDRHDSLIATLHSIKDIGAAVNTESSSTKLTKGQLLRLEAAYAEQFGDDDGLRLTYKVSFFHLSKGI